MKKILTIFCFVFTSFFLFRAGALSGHHYYSAMALDLLVAGFWVSLGAFALWDTVTDRYQEIADHSHKAELDEALGELDEMFGKVLGENKAAFDRVANEVTVPEVSSRRIQIPVTGGDEGAPKPPTKAQQRRANAKKGLGPLTDDEVREQRNAKRREARAANKAAAYRAPKV